MAKIGRLASVVTAVTLTSVFVTGPASAQSARAESYVGSAAGSALDLSVLSLPKVTLGVSTAKVTSGPTAVAEGAGSLLLAGTTTKAEVAGSGSDVKPDACAVPLPLLNVLDIGLACGKASASIANGNPVAVGEGNVAAIDLDAQNLLDAVAPITDLLTGTLGTAFGAVCGLVALACPVTQTVDDLLDSILETDTLSVAAGSSISSVTADSGRVTASATASGAEIRLLPLPVVGGVVNNEPLATIIVGTAKATAVYDRATGVSTPTVDPALVRIKLNTVLTNTLGLGNEISIPIGQSIVVPGTAGTPLETEIVAAAGRTVTNPDGTVSAFADAVKIHALKGVAGGILLSLASAEAGVGGTTPIAAAPVPAVELPRTGGLPWVPVAGVGILGLAVLVRRLRLSAS